MRKMILGVVALALAGGAAWYFRSAGTPAADSAAAGTATGAAGAGTAGAGRAGGRGAGRGASTMTVDTATTSRAEIVDFITVVGNLVGEATVDIVPRVAGRIESVMVRIGDRVARGQVVVKIEDRQIREQVNQVRANLEVNEATVVARENDAKVAKNNLDRARTSFDRELVSQASLEDADSRYNSAISQVTVAKAQLVSTQARLDELSVTLNDTSVVSPVDGFVGKRNLDSGAFAGANTPMLSVVDIGTVRMVANLVEKDFKRIEKGARAYVEVDAFPGEQFSGVVSRVAPVFDPGTRTASMEIEVPNPGFRLKPGMYARVRLTAGQKPNALTVPRAAVIDFGAQKGVYVLEGDVVHFRPIVIGLTDLDKVEVLEGIAEGTRVVTTGALAIRDGDRVALAQAARGGRGGDGTGRGGGRAAESGANGGGRTGGADAAATGAVTGGGRRGASATDGLAAQTGRAGRQGSGGREGRGGRRGQAAGAAQQ